MRCSNEQPALQRPVRRSWAVEAETRDYSHLTIPIPQFGHLGPTAETFGLF